MPSARYLVALLVLVTAGSGVACASTADHASGTATAEPASTRVSNPTIDPEDGFRVDLPPDPHGSFDAVVRVSGVSNVRGFNIGLSFDPGVLRVLGADDSGLLGQNDVFCPKAVIANGTITYACVITGDRTVSAAGAAAVFHFQAISAGSTAIHFRTIDEAGVNDATFAINADTSPGTVPLHDATVLVRP